MNTKTLPTRVYHITYSPEIKNVCLYFKGCNFRCRGCIRRRYTHNIHLLSEQWAEIERKQAMALSLNEISETIDDLEVEEVFYLGVRMGSGREYRQISLI